MAWRYESFYFGHGGWPDEAIWRIDGERKELWMPYPVFQVTREACERLWAKQATEADTEPTVEEKGPATYPWFVSWWRSFTPEEAARIYEKDELFGWGGAKPTDDPARGGTPLTA